MMAKILGSRYGTLDEKNQSTSFLSEL